MARYLAFINLALALFNLVPAFPLDGGRLLRGLLWKTSGRTRATQIAAAAGSLFAFALILGGAVPQWPWVHDVGLVSLWAAALLTLVTGWDYLRAGLRHMD